MLDETTGTAVETVAPPAQGAEGSAPSEIDQTGGAGGQVESPEAATNQSRGLPPRAYREIKEGREYKRMALDLQKRLADLESRMNNPASASNDSPKDIFSDPDGFVGTRVQKAVQEAIAKAETNRAKAEAYKYIQSQTDVTPEDEDDIAQILEDTGLIAVVEKNPKKAVELALKEWRSQRGIASPETSEKAKLAKERARGVAGAPAAGGRKVWTKSEIESIAKDPEQWTKNSADIKAAVAEGRVR